MLHQASKAVFIILISFNGLFALIVNPECSNPLGMESGDIENFQITASSSKTKWNPSKVTLKYFNEVR